MSILINLLPDVRQAKLRERHRRQLVSGVSILVWLLCGGVVALMLIYVAGQNVFISNLTHSIAGSETKLRDVSGLTEALTAQQHLESLPSLYSQRVFLTQFFQAYQGSDPTGVSLNSMTVDALNNLSVTGTAPSYAAVAKLARALAAYNVNVGPNANTSNSPYFTNVAITDVSQDSGSVNFTITGVIGSNAVSGSTPTSNASSSSSGTTNGSNQ